MRSARRWMAVVVLGLAASGLAPSAGAQDPTATLADLALQWSAGQFASPLICQLGDEPLRGQRRIVISPAPARVQPPANRVRFVDLEVENATRCFTELAGDTPNVTGSLLIRLPGRYLAESALRDFRESMRRGRGFEFGIAGGVLKIQAVTQPASPVREVDFAGGRAELQEVREGSDIARLLAPFPSPRKLLLKLAARDGTELSFPLYLTPRR